MVKFYYLKTQSNSALNYSIADSFICSFQASIMSRVTTVLPFVPFTSEEKKAICSEALHTLAGEMLREISPKAIEKAVEGALKEYNLVEGARSLYRAISNKLIDLV